MKSTFYQTKYQEVNVEIKTLTKQSQRLSLFRFLAFILFVLPFMMALYEQNIWFLLPSILFLLSFLFLVKYQAKIENKLLFKKSMLEVIKNYLARFDFTWQSFSNNGQQWYQEKNYLAKDLDLVGPNSLFQYLNLAKSLSGQKKLYNSLVSNELSVNHNLISALANEQAFHLELTSLINLYNVAKPELNLNDGEILKAKSQAIYKFLVNVYSIFTLLILGLALLNIIPLSYLIVVIITNIIIVLLGFKKNKKFLGPALTSNSNLTIITDLLKKVEQYQGETNQIKEYCQGLASDQRASQALTKLMKIKERIESQDNFLVYLLAEIFLMWDYRNVLAYNNWKQTAGVAINDYLNFFSDLEVLLSLGVIEQTKERTCLAKIEESDNPYLAVEGIYHPLLKEAQVVANDFNCQHQTTIITGSNMSGKTTFIKCLGINLVLSYAGASACATKLTCNYLKILTSIRIEDNLNEGISTFYAEIKRIKMMIDYQKEQKPMLCLIDEIFKGTNSEDRIYGAKQAITALTKPYIISFITTHDAQLCELKNIDNYHFKEYYKNDKLMFDYQINKGPAQTRNAKYLLKMVGIIVEKTEDSN